MKKTIYLISISIITIVCVAFSITRDFSFIWYEDEGNYGKYKSDYISFGKIDAIAIDAQVMEVIIKRSVSNEYAIQYSYNKKFEPQYSLNDGVLSIVQSSNTRNIKRPQCSMIITVPKDAKLKYVNAQLDMADIKFSDVYVEEYDIKVALGNIDMKNANFDKAVIGANLGDILIKDSSFTDLKIMANLGDVDIESSKDISDYSFDVRLNMGEVSINGNDYGRGYKKDGKSGTINISNDLGDISVKY